MITPRSQPRPKAVQETVVPITARAATEHSMEIRQRGPVPLTGTVTRIGLWPAGARGASGPAGPATVAGHEKGRKA
jgi:hypothetical protein